MDVGAMTVFLYTFTEREKLYNLIELLTGARFTTSYTRVGGQTRDLPETFIPQLKTFLDGFIPQLDELDQACSRGTASASIAPATSASSPKDRAIAYGLSGPNMRGSGIEYDVRRKHPYLDYEKYDFDIPIGTVGDATIAISFESKKCVKASTSCVR